MQLYFNPPWHLPGRAFFHNKCFQGKRRLRALVTGALVLMITLMPVNPVAAGPTKTATTVSTTKVSKQEHKHHPRDMTYMKRKWGVELLYVRETSANYMLEFRYKVLDADKAKPLFERQTKPVLTHVRTGAKLIVPTPAKTGALRNSNPPKTGKVYWMFFANPRKLVKPGDRVNIDIGEFHANGLVVQK
jgi:hypothetical protein